MASNNWKELTVIKSCISAPLSRRYWKASPLLLGLLSFIFLTNLYLYLSCIGDVHANSRILVLSNISSPIVVGWIWSTMLGKCDFDSFRRTSNTYLPRQYLERVPGLPRGLCRLPLAWPHCLTQSWWCFPQMGLRQGGDLIMALRCVFLLLDFTAWELMQEMFPLYSVIPVLLHCSR